MTPKQHKAIECLLLYPTRKQAAAAAGITARTLTLYFKDPEFLAVYTKAFNGLIDEATRQAQQALSPALTTLKEIAMNEDESAGSRISAARALLEYGLKLTEIKDILEKLESIEGDHI